jgi:flagellar hook-associated protein 2
MGNGITFSGLGSGIDTKSIVEQLMLVESRRLVKYKSRMDNKKSALTVYSDIRSKLSELKSVVSKINTTREFRKVSATTSDEDIFKVRADSTAVAGNHTIRVNQLAQAEMEVSQGYADASDAVGTGTFSIALGAEAAVDITIGANDSSLTGMADAINSANLGVTATIMNDGDPSNPYRLVITSDETGTESALTIDTSGLSGGNVPAFTDGAGGTPGQSAQNALLTFDGVSVTKQGNEIDDLVTGVTIDLLEVDLENTHDLTIESNLDGVKESLDEFVTKYNEIYDYLKEKSKSSLRGDYTVNAIKREIQSLATSTVQGVEGKYSSLSQIGITSDISGHLIINDEDITKALEDNFDDAMQVFTAYGSTDNANLDFLSTGPHTVSGSYNVVITGIGASFGATIDGIEANVSENGNLIYGAEGTSVQGLMMQFNGSFAGDLGNVTVSIGVFEKLNRMIDLYTNSANGMIKTKEESLNSSIRSLNDRMDNEARSLDMIEARMTAKFTKMESLLSSLQTQSAYLGSLGGFR